MTGARHRLDSPIGPLVVEVSAEGVTSIRFVDSGQGEGPCEGRGEDEARAAGRCESVEALGAYFAGDLEAIDSVRVAPAGTAFQLRIWRELRAIPAGQTASYGEIARRVGRPGAARAVGLANARNPIPIVVPCHRVIAADGGLHGYSAGLERKRHLLRHEGCVV